MPPKLYEKDSAVAAAGACSSLSKTMSRDAMPTASAPLSGSKCAGATEASPKPKKAAIICPPTKFFGEAMSECGCMYKMKTDAAKDANKTGLPSSGLNKNMTISIVLKISSVL